MGAYKKRGRKKQKGSRVERSKKTSKTKGDKN
jgi:hypothetical protein